MKYDLSVILPSIRPGNLRVLYDSISKAFSGTFEFIVVGPYQLPIYFKDKTNVKYIKDFGSPTRAQQIALIATEGKYITWAADDGQYLEGSIDIAFKSLEGKDNKTLVVGKYYEGSDNPDMNKINYYYIYTHEASRCKYIPKDCLMVMVGIVPRETLIEIGGLDCRFEALPMAFNDWSIRMYNYGCKFIFQEEVMFRCGHMPGLTGDHAPIHNAQTYYDTPRFRMIYSGPESVYRVKIDIDNWENSPARWGRRFGKT